MPNLRSNRVRYAHKIMTAKELQLVNFMHLFNNPIFALIFGLLAIWTIVWKGIALWKSARNGSNIWFIVLLIVNTLGILEIIYIFFFSEKKKV